MTLEQALPVLIPLVILELGLILLGLRDLAKRERRVKGGSKLVWGAIIVLFQLFGPVLYFAVGREED